MENNGSFIQYEELTVEKLCNHLCAIFEQPVSDSCKISKLLSDDTRNIDKIQKRILNYFGVHVAIEIIVKSESVLDLYKNIKAIIDSPQYLMSEKDIRKSQLEQIAKDKNITALIGTLKNAEDSLQDQLGLINEIQAPTDKVGHKFNAEWLNKLADAIDTKVSRKELIDVIGKQDENYKGAFINLGKAVTATNSWIDAICNALLWIVQIENDLYDISEETSTETFKLSNILSGNNDNVDQLTEFAAKEKIRRQRIQQKIQEFKSDTEGKINFLNDVNKSLRKELDEYKQTINNNFEKEKNILDEKVEASILEMKNKQDEISKFVEESLHDSLEDIQSLINKNINELNQKSNLLEKSQVEFVDSINSSMNNLENSNAKFIEESEKKAEKHFEEMKQSSSAFMDSQNAQYAVMKKQVNVYKIVSLIAITASLASIFFAVYI